MRFDNRVTRMLGAEIPIVQVPMGWIARYGWRGRDPPALPVHKHLDRDTIAFPASVESRSSSHTPKGETP